MSVTRRTVPASKPKKVERRDRSKLLWTAGAICGALVVCSWFVTYGTGRFFVTESFGEVFDAQGKALSEGRWDVDERAISGEAFIRNGKRYTYFGFVPALPRMVLNRAAPSLYGQWSRFSLITALAVSAICAWMFLRLFASCGSGTALRGGIGGKFLLLAILGSTAVFLTSSAFTYHEASAWAASFALLADYCFARFLISGRIRVLCAGCVGAVAAFFTRPTSGLGPIICAGILGLVLAAAGLWNHRPDRVRWFAAISEQLRLPRFQRPAAGAAILALTLVLTLSVFVGINRARFGTFFNSVPLRYHVQYTPERLAQIHGTLIHPTYVLPLLVGYVFAPNLVLRATFPWLAFAAPLGMERRLPMDVLEQHAGILIVMPALSLLAAFGLAGMIRRPEWRRFLLIAGPALMAGCTLFVIAAISHRYAHDLYPFLIVSASAGLVFASGMRMPLRRRKQFRVLLIGLSVWSIAANLALTLNYQREISWATPVQARVSFVKLQARIDHLISRKPYEPVPLTNAAAPARLVRGQTIYVPGTSTKYMFDGVRFQHVAGPKIHEFRIRIRFQAAAPRTRRPVLFAGGVGSSDCIQAVHLEDRKVQFCFDHWGVGGPCGREVAITYGRPYSLYVQADSLNGELQVLLDSAPVLEVKTEFHWWTDKDVLFGRSLVPEAHGRPFESRNTDEAGTVELLEPADGVKPGR